MVRRPQKPFAVEVKRGRKGASSGLPAFSSKPPEPAAVPPAEARPAAPPPEPPKPQRRILEAIEPAPVPASAVVDHTLASSPVVEAFKPRRGRPPKVASADGASVERPRIVKRREEAVVYAYARREVALAADSDAVFVAPTPHKPKKPSPVGGGLSHAGHLTHSDRVEAAVALPRGERWKRRLPKVLW